MLALTFDVEPSVLTKPRPTNIVLLLPFTPLVTSNLKWHFFSCVRQNLVSGDNKFLTTNGNSIESTDSTKFRTFVSDGFQVGSHNGVNGSSNTYVGWSWFGGGTASSNTDGSVTSNVSANTTSGFSICTFTATGSSMTFGHGLGVAPNLVIWKSTR